MTESRAGLNSRLKWLATPERERAAWSLATVGFGGGRRRSGNRVEDAGVGVEIGGAFALTEGKTWGGANFLAQDAMVAEYDPKTGEAWLKDTTDENTPGVKPWRETGEDQNFRLAKPLEGVMARSAAVGPGFHKEHVFFPSRARLISHHREEDPPINSTPISDPGNGDGDWEAGLHGLTRVRPWVDRWCGGNTTTGDGDPIYAALLNFTKSAGDFSGWGGAHFGEGESNLSAEGWGVLRHGAPKHRLAQTDIAEIRRGSIDIDRAIHGDGTDAWSAPVEYSRAQWKDGQKGPFIRRVERRMDFNALHDHPCGPRDGMWKDMSWGSFRDYPPPSEPPIVPPEDPPNPPTVPPETPVYPSPIYLPYKGPTTPSTATPNEIESPSEYGHPLPDGPDAPGETDWPEGGHSGAQFSTLAEEIDDIWLRRFRTTERGWNERAAISTHGIHFNQYENATANEGKRERWVVKKSHGEELSFDEDGWITGRTPAVGPGGKMYAAAEIQRHNLYTGINTELPTTANDFLLGVFAAKDAAGTVYNGRLGIGALVPNSSFIARGWEIRLRYDGAGGITNPDLEFLAKNAAGAESAGGAVVKINGTAISAGGGGDVVGPAGATDLALARFDTATGKLLKNSGVTLGNDAHMIGVAAMTLAEQASALPVSAGQGQYWVENTEPSAPRFTDDDATDHAIMLGSGNLDELSDYDTALSNLGGATTVVPALTDEALTDGGAAELRDVAALGALVFEARLSPSSTLPVATANVTTVSTLYLQPYKGNRVALYNTTDSCWEVHHMSAAVSKALSSLTSGKPYDVFLYDNSGTLTLEFLVWTSTTARATALTTQNGVYVKTGDASRRYVGTFHATASNATAWVTDGGTTAAAKLYIWNYYNRVEVAAKVAEGTTSWTYGSSTYRAMNNDTTNTINMVIGVEEDAGQAFVTGEKASGNTTGNVAIGLDSSSSVVSGCQYTGKYNSTGGLHAIFNGRTAIGTHTYYALERAIFGTVTFNGTTSDPGSVAGIQFKGRF